jgi:hypothetical protein
VISGIPTGVTLEGNPEDNYGDMRVRCTREGCGWARSYEGPVHLTEVSAVAAEHVQERHR